MTIQLEYVEETFDGYHVTTGKFLMPCGCVVQKSTRDKEVLPMTDEDKMKRKRMHESRLIYWFEGRLQWHECSLVNDNDNPNGLIPKEHRKTKVGPMAHLFTKTAQTA